MKFISLFAGVGGFDLALERLGHECVYANDFDKYCKITYDKHFRTKLDTRPIANVSTSEIPNHELLVGGFPCQAFSIAGKRRGFNDTRGTLFFEVARILKDKKPRYFILENVKGLLSHNNGNTFKTIIATLNELGYDLQWQVLNSKNFGVPQNRERVFIVGHIRGQPRPKVFPIGGNNGEVSAGIKRIAHIRGFRRYNQTYDISGITEALDTAQGGGHQPCVMLTERRTDEAKKIRRENMKKGKDWSPRRGKKLVPRNDHIGNTLTANQGKEHFLLDGARVRRLTPIECERLQGFPDNWTEGVSDTQKYKQLGNAVTVNVVYEIAKRL